MSKTSKQTKSINNTNKKYKNKKTKKLKKNVKNYSSNNKINKMRGGVITEQIKNIIRKLQSFKILDISWNKIDYEGATALAEALKVNTTLTTLNISYNNIDDEGATALAAALGKDGNKTLTTLNITYNNIGDEGATALAEALKENKTLTTLDISGNDIGVEGATALAAALKVNKTLITLNIILCKIGAEGAKAFAKALGKDGNRILTTLNIDDNNITDAGISALAEALGVGGNTSLKYLYISRNDIGVEGGTALAAALGKDGNTTLTTLNIYYNNIGDEGATAFAEALGVGGNTALTTLDISRNNITDAGISALAEGLKVNTALTNINISYNRIGHAGAAALAEAVGGNTSLKELNISNNIISDVGTKAFAEALGVGGNRALTTLDISRNNITDAGISALAEALKVNTALTTLDIIRNNITDAGISALAEAIKVNTSLTTLDISYNRIGDDGALFIAEALKVNTTLTTLNIIMTDISRDLIRSLNIKLSNRKIFNPSLIPLKVPLDNSITQTLNFIKKKMKYKNLSDSNTPEKIFDEYVNNLTISDEYFNTLIKSNYDAGYKATQNILGSEKYMVDLHGSVVNSIFKLPDNITIVFFSPLRYLTCINILSNKSKIEKYFDEYLKDPYCFKNSELYKLFKEAIIYYGGQYCIDLNLSRSAEKKEHVTGLHYMEKKDGNYILNIPYKYNEGNYSDSLSNFVKTEINVSGTQFINPEKQYTLLLTSCRESDHLDYLHEDILVFYEQILKRLNFKVNYDNNKTEDNKLEDNKLEDKLNSKYKECNYEKEKDMDKNINHFQYKRNNLTKKKGKIQSRRNTHNNNSTVIMSKTAMSDFIEEVKNDIQSIKDPNDDKLIDLFIKLFKILNIKFIKVLNKIAISLETKEKIKMIQKIFGDNYLLMFKFLIYCQMNIMKTYDSSNNNSQTNLFFLEYVFDNIKKLRTLDLSKVHININLQIFNYIDKLFKDEKALTTLDISDNNIGLEAILVLAEALKDNTTLTTLDISNNYIGDEGAIALAEAVGVGGNRTLTTINISKNIFIKNGEKNLAEALKVNQKSKMMLEGD